MNRNGISLKVLADDAIDICELLKATTTTISGVVKRI